MQTTNRNRMNWPRLRSTLCLVLAVAAALFAPTRAFSQSSSSAVNGVVADSTGAQVPGAKVVLTDVATNVARVTVSNGSGDYNFVSVPPARYTLTISAPAFQTQKTAPFDVAVDQRRWGANDD